MQYWLTFWRSLLSQSGRNRSRLWLFAGSIVVLLLCVIALLLRDRLSAWMPSPSVVSQPLQSTLNATSSLGLNPYPSWHSTERLSTKSVAWGDVDGDGDLDLAVGSSPVQIYHNEGQGLQTSAAWAAADQGEATSVAWGDVDSDGDLDLAVANEDAPSRVYLNEAGVLQSEASWFSEESGGQSVAWGDMDGDSDFDLAVGYQAPADEENPCCTANIYLNEGGLLQSAPTWSAAEVGTVESVAWGDLNGDGRLDLIVGSSTPEFSLRLYLHEGGVLQTTSGWSPREQESVQSVAWGDVDNDGDLDLAVGVVDAPNRLYLNNGGSLGARPAWSSDESDATQSVAWGDVDNDGDLDLAVGNGGFDPDRVYLNEAGMLQTSALWSSNEQNDTQAVAWGDVDGDGDLDLAVGSQGAQNWVYTNQTGTLAADAAWSSPESDNTFSVAWGDLNEDGLLDLAVGNVEAPNRVYTAQADTTAPATSWSSIEKEDTQSVAWGDIDGDGDLDLTFGNLGAIGRIHLNEEGHLQTATDWAPQKMYTTFSMAWGDLDGDSDLDLAVGNGGRIPNRVYRNEGGLLLERPVWSAAQGHSTWQVAWGDVDNDGDLDLAVGNHGAPNELYLNEGGLLQSHPAWVSVDSHQTTSVAWGDVDGDGDLDLAVGNQGAPNQLYQNDAGALSVAAVWASNEADQTQSVAWGDVDGDGDLDLAVGNWGVPNRIYANERGKLQPSAIWSASTSDQTQSIAWGDAEGDGDLDLAVGNWGGPNRIYRNRQPTYPFYPSGFYRVRINLQTQPTQGDDQPPIRTLAPANGYSVAHIRSGVIPIAYRLFHPNGEPVRAVRAYYSLNGGGNWQPAVPMDAGQTLDLTPITGEEWSDQLFLWNVAASRLSGQSDNVIFRLEALPNLRPLPNRIPGPFQRPLVATQTFPFRVRGAQVQVVDGNQQPVKEALVYYLPQNQTRNAQPIADHTGQPYRTDEQGYLQGRSLLVGQGDHLVALQMITATTKYTLYHTSAAPTLDGLAMFTVADALAQQLVVTAANPLLLFNLSLSLEWDARKEIKYLTDLQLDLQRTSELLYDWTNGQAALGDITIYHNKEQWQEADLRIYATNRLYPYAPVGGVVRANRVEATDATQAIVYRPGQVAMPAVWNRYDRAGRNLGEDWARTLARALGQYLFFLQDSTIGVDAQGAIKVITACPGVMRDPYTEVNSEYHPAAQWLPACAETFAQRQSGRYDWATITHFYPWLHEPTGPIDDVPTAGPKLLPLAVTNVRFVEPTTPVLPVDVPAFTLVKADGGQNGDGAYLATHRARAFLFQADEAGRAHLLDLGTPIYDQIQAWNARPTDRLCIYDLSAKPTPVSGCNAITANTSTLTLYPQQDWQPDVAIVAATAERLTIQVTNVRDDLRLQAHLYPYQPSATITGPITIPLTFDSDAGAYLGAIAADEALAGAYVAIADTLDAQRNIVTDYTLTRVTIGNEPFFGRSMDGQVVLYGVTTDAAAGGRDNEFTLVQPATRIPTPPNWATVVGDAYRVTMAATPAVAQMAIRINYPGYAIEDDKEALLRIHFWDGFTWRELPTTVDQAHNITLATAPESGIYTLMVGIAPPLSGAGVNLTVYPISGTTALSGTMPALTGDPLELLGADALQNVPGNGACRVVSMLFCSP